jgi:(p)ppGpp synthase/HD superfamily hydrolase
MLIDLAIETALKFHAGQFRKGADIPYAVHPLAVGMILAGAGCSDEVIAAGILHDTLEDTSMTVDEVRNRFGREVASMVMACSEPDKSLPWEIRKQHTIASMKNAPLEVRVIVCADKLHNLRTMAGELKKTGEDLWKRFNRGRTEQAWYYKSLVRAVCERKDQGKYAPLFLAFKNEVERLLSDAPGRCRK